MPSALQEFERSFHSPERVDWIRSLVSVASGRVPCVNVHVASGGMSRRADYRWIVPLTAGEHHELHQHGAKTFEKKWRLSLRDCAEAVNAKWESLTH